MSLANPQPLTPEGSVEAFYVHGPYVLIFSKTSVDIWRTGGPHGHLEHIAALAQFVLVMPYHLDPVFDTDRNLIIIVDGAREHNTPSLLVFSLVDGRLIRKLELYGTMAEDYPLYADGKILVNIEEDKEHFPPYGITKILLCDVVGDGGVLSSVNLPARLQAREQMRRNTNGGVLLPVHVRPNGDIFATSTEQWGDKMEVLCWRGADVPKSPEPAASFTLEVGVEDGDDIFPTCSTPLDEETFLLAVYEADGDVIATQSACQTSIYAIDVETMTIRWHAKPNGGSVHTIRYVAALDVIVAFGQHDNGDGIKSDRFNYVVVLDPATGSQRRMETISHGVQGSPVEYGGLSPTADDFLVVIVFRDGSTCAVDLKHFLEHGFPRLGERVAVSGSPLGERSNITKAVVSGQTVIVTVGHGSQSRSMYFTLP
ncbi:uncharacterized protein C8Q71DRAFT_486425 [Rhodofomes roseus]|uniref:Cleavage/polyadenylation specificity factor A subunit N-terminal domain-containing protein n=1 Tax=Rhodofomes roseus TaxID=34475 RepID=A0ABQ8KPS4_9APHY|nr:uncharacterized protein C8Q71DRAFT_486425 [Rhodofomes roseus]KAH9840326.1 hypothetical protein C8Q71DRAFT_486425 [Rhodofomes roseus]